jgi:hypothetical protein
MRIYAILILMLLFSFGTKAQLPINAVKLADSLLSSGNHQACFVSYEFPERIRILQEKAISNLKSNPQWADKYIVILMEQGFGYIHYMDAYGLTHQEFDTLLIGFKNRQEAILKDTFDIRIKKDNGLISFYAKGKASVYNYLSIDTKKNQIIYDHYILTGEYVITGKFYAPILQGYEVCGCSGTVKGEESKLSLDANCFSIGINKDDNRATIVLLFQRDIRHIDPITITILN